jgi:hypothetical protein
MRTKARLPALHLLALHMLALLVALPAACGGGSPGEKEDPLPPGAFAGSWTTEITVTSSSCPNNIGSRTTVSAVLVENGSVFRWRDATEAPGNEFVGTIQDGKLQMVRGRDSLELELAGADAISGRGLKVDAFAVCTDGLGLAATRVLGAWSLAQGEWSFVLSENGQTLETFDPAPLIQEFAALRGAANRLRGALEVNLWTGVVQVGSGGTFQFSGSFAASRDSFSGSWTEAGGRSGLLTGVRQTGGTCLTIDAGTWDFAMSDLGGARLATFDAALLTQNGCEVVVTWSDATGALELRGNLSGISGAAWTPAVGAVGTAPNFAVTQGQFTTPTSYSGLFDASAFGGTTGILVGDRR